jgi:hypothetical protein
MALGDVPFFWEIDATRRLGQRLTDMNTQRFSIRFAAALSFTLSAVACGSSEEPTTSTKTVTTPDGMSKTVTCSSGHLCVNGACKCTTVGKKDDPCTNDEKCESECEICK